MKRFFLILVSLTLIIGFFASFNPMEAKEPTKITFWFPGADKASDDYFSNAAKEFETLNPNIKIESVIVSANPQDIETKLNSSQLNGTYPDVFLAFLAFIGTRGSRGEFADLGSYIGSWDEKNDILDSAYNMGKYKGKTIGLGFFPVPEVLTYRKDYFKEAGLDPEKPPASWEELAAYAEKLTKRDSNGSVIRAGFDIPLVDSALVFTEPFLRQNGSKVIDEKKQIPAFNDKNAIEALQFLVNLENKKVSIPFDYQKKDTIPFSDGKSAMSFLQTTQISKMIANDQTLKDNLGFVPVLKRKAKVSFCGYRLFTIGKDSKHKKEAWGFIKFMMSKQQMWKRCVALKIPVVRKSLETDFINQDPVINKVVMDYVRYGKGKATVPWTSIANKHLSLAFTEAMNNKKTPEQALKDAQAALEEELKKTR